MLMVIYADLGEYMTERRSSDKIKVKIVKAKRDANGRLVPIGNSGETVRVKASSRHDSEAGNRAGAGLGTHQLIKDASGRLVVCDNIGNVLSGTKIKSIDTDGSIQLWRGNGIHSVSFSILIEPREFARGLMQYPNCTQVEAARIYPSLQSTKFAVGCRVDKILQYGLAYDNLGVILYFSRVREVTHHLTAMVNFEDRLLTLTGDDDYVAALVHWLSAR